MILGVLFIVLLGLGLAYLDHQSRGSDEYHSYKAKRDEEIRTRRRHQRQLRREAREAGISYREMKEIDKELYPEKYFEMPAMPLAGGVYRTGYGIGGISSYMGLYVADLRGIVFGLLMVIFSSCISFGVDTGYWPNDRYDFWKVIQHTILSLVIMGCIGGLIVLLLGGCN